MSPRSRQDTPNGDPSRWSPTSSEVDRRTLVNSLALAGVVGGVGLLSACGSGTSARPGTSSASISVRDQRGKTISLARPARRVVTLPMPAASLMIAVDQGPEHLVGMHQASWVAMRDGIMGKMFPAALRIPHGVASQGFAPNVESILALKPDVVVQWGDQGDGLIAPLTNAGLQVAALTGSTQKDIGTWITLFAELVGKPARAKEMNARIDREYQKAKTLGESRTSGPNILYFNQFANDLKVGATKTSDDFYIKLIGATNAATGHAGVNGTGMVGVDKEQVLAWDPDIILLGNFDKAMPKDLYSDAVWRSLTAVRSKRVYKVPLGGYRWDPPSHESPLMWQWVDRIAYPQSGASDLRAQVKQYYAFVYGVTPTDAQLDTLLWMEANAESAHYQQFHAS